MVQEEFDLDDLVQDLYLTAMQSGDVSLDGGDDGVLTDDVDRLALLDFRGVVLDAI